MRARCDLRSSARARYLPFIEQEFPHLAKRYWATYAFDHKVSETYSFKIARADGAICARHGVPYGRWGATEEREDQSEAIAERFANGEQLNFEWNNEPRDLEQNPARSISASRSPRPRSR